MIRLSESSSSRTVVEGGGKNPVGVPKPLDVVKELTLTSNAIVFGVYNVIRLSVAAGGRRLGWSGGGGCSRSSNALPCG